ncbi:MAG: hypothetical protein JRI51_02850 [Deltaproteobacteria bacterium]|nr:hypothetical protein [Deltaproteobacteria bacterium]
MKRTAAILLVGTWIGLSACCNPVVAGELAGSHPSTFSATGTIIAKDKAGLTLKRGDYFVASYMTKVIIDDKPFRLVSLPIPCKARIEYTVKKGWVAQAHPAIACIILHRPSEVVLILRIIYIMITLEAMDMVFCALLGGKR